MVIVLSPCRPRRLAALGLQRDQKSGSILALPLVASYHCRIPLVRYPWRRGASRDTSTWLMIATKSHAAHSSLLSLSFARSLPSLLCLSVSPYLSLSLSFLFFSASFFVTVTLLLFSLSATPGDAGGIAAVAVAIAQAQYRVCDWTLLGNFLLPFLFHWWKRRVLLIVRRWVLCYSFVNLVSKSYLF